MQLLHQGESRDESLISQSSSYCYSRHDDDDDDEAPQISRGRKPAYYLGSGISLLGILLFLSTFVSFAIIAGGNISNNIQNIIRNAMLRTVIGMF
mmetsp:Transcript_13384/g.22159  ORF Transcript_13384/g.22159 Transcript_13384/m.22159 type:complete len:95 (+) Transcript_13384:91-375(+)